MPNEQLFSYTMAAVVVVIIVIVIIAVFEKHLRNRLIILHLSYIMAVSFIGGGNQSTLRKAPTCHKSLTNFIT
jgi:c-di-AMP phosphodiesterase-like protein